MTNLQDLFPITLPNDWQVPEQAKLNDNLTSWLLEPSSLTARLQSQCDTFKVVVLGQEVITCTAQDACTAVAIGEEILVREVLLYCDQQPHVFARSVLPLSSLTGDQQQLANLGEQPLGHIIFNNPSLQRKHIEVAAVTDKNTIKKLNRCIPIEINQTLWGRRSIFYLENKPLIVCEVFLPTANAYKK